MTPAEVPCPFCETDGCEECNGDGYFLLTSCPGRFIDPQIQECFTIADLFKEGVPPTDGGSLAQTRWFLSFCSRLWGEENRINEAKMKAT